MAVAEQQLAEDSLQEQANKVLDQARYLADSIVPGGSGAVSPSVFLGGVVAGLSIWHVVAPSSVDETLALVPHHTVFTVVGICPIPFVWNVVTGHFFEGHMLKAVFAVPSVVALGRLLERLWAAKAIAMHVLFSVTCAGAAFFLTELIHVYRTNHEKDFFIPVNGCVGLITAMAVGVRHGYPLEPLPYIPKALRLKYQHLPFAITIVACVLGFLFPGNFTEWLFAPFAFFFGWLHIRYVMWFPHAQAHGDHSADFLFSSLFPRPFRPLVGCLGAIVHKLVSLAVPSFVQLRSQVDCEAGGGSIAFGASSGAGASGLSGASSGFAASAGAGGLRPGAAGSGGAAGRPGAAGAPGAEGRPVLPGGPGSAEYNARRAKALALLDQNIEAMLVPSSSSADSGKASGRSAAAASTGSVEMDDKISALLASTKVRKQQLQAQESAAPTGAAALPVPAEGGAPAPVSSASLADDGGGSQEQPPMENGGP